MNSTGSVSVAITEASQQYHENSPGVLEQEEIVKSLLAKHHGSTKNAEVLAAIEKLSAMNPIKCASSSALLEGEFLCHTLPEFPGRIKDSPPDTIQYTLGRLSFNIFQPHNLVCTVRSVRQCIQSRNSLKDQATGEVNRSKFRTFEYPICLDLTIHAPKGDLPAVMCHSGVFFKSPKVPQRFSVAFKGSTLMPAYQVRSDPALLKVWKETFHNAYKNADKERGFWSKALRMAIKWWFDMELPSDDEVGEDYSVNYQMKRSPRGHLDFLYLSERLRITRGNRGTLVVVERMDITQSTF